MTPKDKANEIYEWMKDVIPFPDYYTEGQYLHHVRSTSIAHVDEIIKAVRIAQTEIEEYSDYWKEVKQEIEKL